MLCQANWRKLKKSGFPVVQDRLRTTAKNSRQLAWRDQHRVCIDLKDFCAAIHQGEIDTSIADPGGLEMSADEVFQGVGAEELFPLPQKLCAVAFGAEPFNIQFDPTL